MVHILLYWKTCYSIGYLKYIKPDLKNKYTTFLSVFNNCTVISFRLNSTQNSVATPRQRSTSVRKTVVLRSWPLRERKTASHSNVPSHRSTVYSRRSRPSSVKSRKRLVLIVKCEKLLRRLLLLVRYYC